MANLIGTKANQVPVNGMLGLLAFQDTVDPAVERAAVGTLANKTLTAPVLNGFLTGTGIDVASRVGIQPTLDLDFARQRYSMYDSAAGGLSSVTLASILTYTGANRTFVDAMGILRVQASNVPRLTFDPVTGVSNGLSVFEARTNLITFSEQLDNAAWQKTGTASVTANTVIAPDGTLTMDSLTNVSLYANRIAQQSPILASTAYTLSFYASSNGNGSNIFADFNSVGGTFTSTSTAISLLPGVNRYSVSFTSGVGNTGVFAILYGNASTTGFNIWGAQLEAGASPTPYIPTTTAAVTAPADVASLTGTNFSKWFNPSEGTFVWQHQSVSGPSSDVNSARSFTVSDGTDNNRMIGFGNRITFFSGNVADGSAFIGSNTTGNIVRSSSYVADQLSFSNAGAPAATDVAFTMPVGLNVMHIGNNLGITQLNGTISRILYFPRALPANLQQLSA